MYVNVCVCMHGVGDAKIWELTGQCGLETLVRRASLEGEHRMGKGQGE